MNNKWNRPEWDELQGVVRGSLYRRGVRLPKDLDDEAERKESRMGRVVSGAWRSARKVWRGAFRGEVYPNWPPMT